MWRVFTSVLAPLSLAWNDWFGPVLHPLRAPPAPGRVPLRCCPSHCTRSPPARTDHYTNNTPARVTQHHQTFRRAEETDCTWWWALSQAAFWIFWGIRCGRATSLARVPQGRRRRHPEWQPAEKNPCPAWKTCCASKLTAAPVNRVQNTATRHPFTPPAGALNYAMMMGHGRNGMDRKKRKNKMVQKPDPGTCLNIDRFKKKRLDSPAHYSLLLI